MIDPKLNELPVETAENFADTSEADLTDEQRAQRSRRPRAGLSVKDTIAGDTMLSVGGRGVDTSGVRSGAGAGAGMTSLTPSGAGGGSPAPNIAPGPAATGTTPRGATGPDQIPTTRLEDRSSPTRDQVAARAYKCWHERGCPHGSPEVDWNRAEQELREECERNSAATGSAASAGGR